MIKKLSGKLAFLLAVVMATMVGGITTAVVMAAIPDASGQITACRRTNNGDTRIIDTATESCNGNETAIGWSQGGSGDGAQAYGLTEQVYDPVTDTTTIQAKPGFSEHIESIAKTSPFSSIYCVNFDSTVQNPKQILVTGSSGSIDATNGTLATAHPDSVANNCPGADAVLYGGNSGDIYFRVY